MKIGLFSDTYLPDINGVVTSIETLRHGLIELGHEVYIIANHSSLLTLKYEDNILLLPGIELKFLFDYNLSGPMNFRALDIIKDMNLDVIHVHTEFGVGIFARIAARILDIPLVYTYHTTYEDYTHYVNFFNSKTLDKVAKKAVASLSKMLSNPASLLITPSHKTKTMLEGYGIERPMHVIPTGINLERFDHSKELDYQRQMIRHNYQIDEEATVFIFVGRIAEEKNIQLVLNAFEKLVHDHHDLYFMIVGSGPDLDTTIEWINNRGLQSRIICTNRIENTQIPGYYHSADAFVSASMTETQGLTYIEAMACGLPIFASDMSVLEDLLFEEKTGFYFDDEESFINKVNHFLSLSVNEKEVINHIAKETVKPYDARIFAESISEVYQLALDQYKTEYSVEAINQLKEDYYQLKLISASGQIKYHVVNEQQLTSYQIKEDRILDQQQLQQLARDDKFTQKYNLALDRLTYKDYSSQQLTDYLEKSYPEATDNDLVIEILKQKNLLNDERLIEEVITRQREKGYGYYRIEKYLQPYVFEDTLLENHLSLLDENQYIDCENALLKNESLVYYGSQKEGLNRLKSKLIRNGFESHLVNQMVETWDFKFDNELLDKNCNKEYERFMKRYLRQHEESVAAQKTVQALLNKGFNYETIQRILAMRKEN